MQQALILLLALALGSAMVLLGIWQLRVYTAQGAAAAERRNVRLAAIAQAVVLALSPADDDETA